MNVIWKMLAWTGYLKILAAQQKIKHSPEFDLMK